MEQAGSGEEIYGSLVPVSSTVRVAELNLRYIWVLQGLQIRGRRVGTTPNYFYTSVVLRPPFTTSDELL